MPKTFEDLKNFLCTYFVVFEAPTKILSLNIKQLASYSMHVIMHMFIEGILSTKILSQNNNKFDDS